MARTLPTVRDIISLSLCVQYYLPSAGGNLTSTSIWSYTFLLNLQSFTKDVSSYCDRPEQQQMSYVLWSSSTCWKSDYQPSGVLLYTACKAVNIHNQTFLWEMTQDDDESSFFFSLHCIFTFVDVSSFYFCKRFLIGLEFKKTILLLVYPFIGNARKTNKITE